MPAAPIDIQAAARSLDQGRVFERLERFDPRWVGSIPLDVHLAGADADICCSARDLAGFRSALDAAFGGCADYRASLTTHAGEPSVIARFALGGLPVEIYGRERPVETHESYVHWRAEDRLLRLGGARLRTDVRAAKARGLKTEPAFAACLKLGGDPYSELLKLASPPDAALAALLAAIGYRGSDEAC